MKVLTVLAALCWLFVGDVSAAAAKTLAGVTVVVDPGHGGRDPGARGAFQGKEVFESEYCYDIAKRIEREVASRGGQAFLTIVKMNRGADRVRDLPPAEVLPRDASEVFRTERVTVRGGSWGRDQRLLYANRIAAGSRGRKVFFVSVHFDALRRSELEGVRIIAPDVRTSFVARIGEAFGRRKRLRTEYPIVASGDKNHGISQLHILSSQNQISDRVLIEFGNFANTTDVWRIRDPKVRADFALAVAEALETHQRTLTSRR